MVVKMAAVLKRSCYLGHWVVTYFSAIDLVCVDTHAESQCIVYNIFFNASVETFRIMSILY